jgi:hypothetical protein
MHISKIHKVHKAIINGWNNDVGPYINLIAYITIPETAIAYLLKGWIRIGSAAVAVIAYVLVLFLCWHFGKRK